MTQNKSYYAIIPANVRYNKNLSANAKLLYGELTALCNEKGYCWASNNYFADLYGVSPQAVSKWVNLLADEGYIYIEYEKEGQLIKQRNIYICEPKEEEIESEGVSTYVDTYQQKIKGVSTKSEGGINKRLRGYQQKIKGNNTINNTINNTQNRERKQRFIPPSLLEIEEYINLKNLKVNPKDFYDYFTVSNWIDSKGAPVKNWKQKLITWNSYQNKASPAPINQKTLSEIEKECRGLFT